MRASADHERQIVSDASHELRTPIAALTARLELAHRSFGDAPALEREIVAAETSLKRLSDLATTLLELSRLDQSTVGSTPAPSSTAADLRRELLDSVDRARIAPGASGIVIEFSVDDVDDDHDDSDDRVSYATSVSSFGRICDNLLVNAVTFSPDGGTVHVTLEQEDDSDRALLLTVTDEGPGLPQEFLAHAFDRFSRADDSRRRVRGGNGLGLALVRGLAMQAGGTADIDNRDTPGAVATGAGPRPGPTSSSEMPASPASPSTRSTRKGSAHEATRHRRRRLRLRIGPAHRVADRCQPSHRYVVDERPHRKRDVRKLHAHVLRLGFVLVVDTEFDPVRIDALRELGFVLVEDGDRVGHVRRDYRADPVRARAGRDRRLRRKNHRRESAAAH
ncbi:hypothetical protein GCM10025867_08090 [Frondihabitans sucicola]|uniref:histidine kinase n=1 Tax=Frondihabitans sucicola TaxID=1268041 RepID=A0ABM8GJL3_9MICO|nr:hypothetical protein GCM10025867_08090 [Frondihabitans sucicola]